MSIRRYSELRTFPTHEERYEYLRLKGAVGDTTFGVDRYINQNFYRSAQWKHTRNLVIARDMGMDLGIPGFEIYDNIVVHHMNPMTAEAIVEANSDILDPEYLISCTLDTHNSIHYGNASTLRSLPAERRQGDTNLW